MTKYGLLKAGLLAAGTIGVCVVALNWFLYGRIGKISRIILVCLVAGGFLYVYPHYIEPNWIEVHKVTVRDKALAEVVGETRIVHITDIHVHGELGFREKMLIKKVNRLKPDLLLITGDFGDSPHDLENVKKLIGSFKVKVGIFGVPGDTDMTVINVANVEAFRHMFRKFGVELLWDESRPVLLPDGKTLWLAGVGDARASSNGLRNIMGSIPAGAPVILLSHVPEIFKAAVAANVNLVLAGDTHGGQVGIPLLVKLSKYANRHDYVRGMFTENSTSMYVNRGIGMKTLYIRFLCRPEIAEIKIKS